MPEMERIKIEKRPRDEEIDILNNDNYKIPRIQTANKESWDLIWNELRNIVKTLVSVHGSEINYKEFNDLLMIISSGPDNLTFFDDEYGSQNVEIAIKKASKILYPKGIIDDNLSAFLWNKRDELMLSLKLSSSAAWRGIKTVAGVLHNANIFHIPKYQKIEFEKFESKLLILMSVDPDILRNDELGVEIGKSKREIGILQCKHILEGIMKENRKKTEFQGSRNKKILLHGRMHLKEYIADYDNIFKKVRVIVQKYWNERHSQQLDALTVLFIMEPKLVHSKFLMSEIHCNYDYLTAIEDEVKTCLKHSIDCSYTDDDEKKDSIIVKEIQLVADIGPINPIIYHLEAPTTAEEMRILRKRLRRKFKSELHPKILEWSGRYIVFANAGAVDWLKTTLDEKNEIWRQELSVQMLEPKYIEVGILSQLRLREPFSTQMENIKEQYPALHTEKWKFLMSESDWMIYVRMDIDSVAELEQRKRRIQVNAYILKFEIFYGE